MSALGERVAVVSLGLSCQTSRQIDGQVPLLRELTGDATLEKASLPFDWLISTPDGLTSLIEQGRFFPEDRSDLDGTQARLRSRSHDVIYWHVSRHAAKPGNATFDEARSKFNYTSKRFDRIAGMDRVIAIMSDTQPNLTEVGREFGLPLTETRVGQAADVHRAFETFLGRSVEFLFVSRNHASEGAAGAGFSVRHMRPHERGGWAGDGRAWAATLKDYFEIAEAH